MKPVIAELQRDVHNQLSWRGVDGCSGGSAAGSALILSLGQAMPSFHSSFRWTCLFSGVCWRRPPHLQNSRKGKACPNLILQTLGLVDILAPGCKVQNSGKLVNCFFRKMRAECLP